MLRRFPALAAILTVGLSLPASAAPVFDTFGPLPAATFGGSGIPNGSVAITEMSLLSGATLTLGLTATQRFSNPVVTDDGAGTFFATSGLNDGLVGSSTLGATWNLSFYAGLSDGTFADNPDLTVGLAYDTDPTAGVDFGFLDLTILLEAFGDPSTADVIEGSQNLTFDFLNIGPAAPGASLPGNSFNPFATGIYEMSLVAGDPLGVASNTIDVIVGAVPLPGAVAIFGTGLVLLGLRRRIHA